MLSLGGNTPSMSARAYMTIGSGRPLNTATMAAKINAAEKMRRQEFKVDAFFSQR
jgi:hypothetical protein